MYGDSSKNTKKNTCNVSHVLCHVSSVTSHMSPVMTTTLCSFRGYESTSKCSDAAAGVLVIDKEKAKIIFW